MRTKTIIAISVLLTALPCLALAGAGAEQQVICQPGVRIHLDEKYLGQCVATDGGYFIETSPGEHVLKATRPGYVTELVRYLNLKKGPNPDLEIIFKEPQMIARHPKGDKAAKEAAEQVKTGGTRRGGKTVITVVEQSGSVNFRSVPPLPEAVIVIDGEIVGNTPAVVEGVRVGTRDVRLLRNNEVISNPVTVKENKEITLKADFRDKTLTTENAEALGYDPVSSVLVPGERAVYDLLEGYVKAYQGEDLKGCLGCFASMVNWFNVPRSQGELKKMFERDFNTYNKLRMELSNYQIEMKKDRAASVIVDRSWHFHGHQDFCGKARTRFSLKFEGDSWKISGVEDLKYYSLHSGDCPDK